MNTLTELLYNSIAQRIAWCLIHFLWQGTAVALLLGITLSLLRNRSARERWATSCAAMALMAVLPIATAMLVSVEIPERSESSLTVVSSDPIPTLLPGGSGEFPTESELSAPLQPGLTYGQELSEAAPPVGSVSAAQGEQPVSHVIGDPVPSPCRHECLVLQGILSVKTITLVPSVEGGTRNTQHVQGLLGRKV